jgi:uncharacterized protein DUF6496
MAKQSRAQKKTVERVMHEHKHGELRIRGKGTKVKNRKQAIAVALHEAGATRQGSPKKNRRNLRRTKTREHKGETAQARTEGRGASRRSDGRTKAELYQEAKRRDIPGRSKMSKGQLERSLRR